MKNSTFRRVGFSAILIATLAARLHAEPFVAGCVMSDDGKPIAGARVLVYDMYLSLNDNTPPFSTATTDAEGSFKLPCPAVTFTLFVQANGFGMFTATPPPTVGDDRLKITLDPPTTIRFKAIGMDGVPHAGVGFVPYSITSERGATYLLEPLSQQLAQTTDENGVCVFPNMPRDSSILFQYAGFERSGGVVETGDNALVDAGPVEIMPGATIQGRVIRADTGQPMPNLRVGQTITDADGRFRMTGVSAGVFSLQADLISPLSGQLVSEVTKVTVSGTDQLKNVEIKLVKGMLIHGKVTSRETGTPIENAQVQTFHSPPGTPHATIRTGPDGTYAMVLPPGQHTLFIHYVLRSGFQRQDNNLPVVTLDDAHPEATVDFQLTPDPLAAVKGRVVDPEGNPVAGAFVVATPDGSGGGFGKVDFSKPMVQEMAGGSTTTDPDGKFLIPFVADRARLTVVKGYSRLKDSILIDSNRRDLNITLPRTSTGSMLVRAGDDHDRPLAGVKLMVTWRDGLSQYQQTRVTEADGTYRFGPLFEGFKYTIEASRDGYTKESKINLNIERDKELSVRLNLSKADSFVAGKVVDDGGHPIAGAVVRTVISREPNTTYASARTDAEGHFRIDGLLPGSNNTLYTRVAPYTGEESRSQTLVASVEDAVIVYQPSPPPQSMGRGGRAAP